MPDNPSTTTSTQSNPVSVTQKNSREKSPRKMNKLLNKLSRTDKASWTATLMLTKKNMTKRENNCKESAIQSSKPEPTRREKMNNNKNSVMMDFDLILYKT